jgi:hypothetical protein
MQRNDLFWRRIVPHVLKKKRTRLGIDPTKHKSTNKTPTTTTLGVDLAGWFQEDGHYFRELVKAVALNKPIYQPFLAMEMIAKRHGLLLNAGITPLYVLPGNVHQHPHPSQHDRRWHKAAQQLQDFAQKSMAACTATGEGENDNEPVPPQSQPEPLDHMERRKPREYARLLGLTANPNMVQFLAQWMRKQNMTILQAPYEAVWQLVALEQSGITHGTISNDAVCVALGSRTLHVHATFGRTTGIHCYTYNVDEDLVGHLPHYKFDLSSYRYHLPELFALTGTSPYLPLPRSGGRGGNTKDVMKKQLPQYFYAVRSVLDKDVDGTTMGNHTKKFWQRQNVPRDYPESFYRVVHLLRYCPVLKKKPTMAAATPAPVHGIENGVAAATTTTMETTTTTTMDEWELVPLNPLPAHGGGTSWRDFIQFDPFDTLLPLTPDQYTRAFYMVDNYTFQRPTELDEWCRHVKPIIYDNNKYNDRHNKNGTKVNQDSKKKQKKKPLAAPPPKYMVTKDKNDNKKKKKKNKKKPPTVPPLMAQQPIKKGKRKQTKAQQQKVQTLPW